MPVSRELVVFRAPVIVRCSPVRFDPTSALQTMQGRIKRSLLYPKNVTRHLLNALGNGPTVLRTKRERSQDKQVESTLRKVDPLRRHVLPFRFYTGQYSTSCRSARGASLFFENAFQTLEEIMKPSKLYEALRALIGERV